MGGIPTFKDFSKNPDLFRTNEEEAFNQVDKGSSVFYKGVQYKYEIEGYKCKSLEEVERIAKSQGIPIKELDYQPEIIPQGGGKAQFNVKFISKAQRDKRNGL